MVAKGKYVLGDPVFTDNHAALANQDFQHRPLSWRQVDRLTVDVKLPAGLVECQTGVLKQRRARFSATSSLATNT